MLFKNLREIKSELEPLKKSVIMTILKDLNFKANDQIKAKLKQHFLRLITDSVNHREDYDRALWVRLGYELVGKRDWKDVLPAMLATEIDEESITFIDDFIDDEVQRGRSPTLYKKHGTKHMIIANGIIIPISVELLLKNADTLNLDKKQQKFLINILMSINKEVSFYQFSELFYGGIDVKNMTKSKWLDLYKFGTGGMIQKYALIGAVFGNASKEELKAISNIGMSVGILQQIRDDYIDYIDNKTKIGKTPFTDIRNRRLKFPIILAYKYANQKDKVKLEKILGKRDLTTYDKERIVRLIFNTEAIKEAIKFIKNLEADIVKNIKRLPNPTTSAKQCITEILKLETNMF